MGNIKNMYTKEEIIEEIQRTTKENDGKPLGQTKFAKETGIGMWDWCQYWSKYGDACIAAGFRPNKPWTKYPEGVLEEKLVPLIRKLGKYPTINEMRLEYKKNPDFPFNAIKKRQRGFIINLYGYCEKKSGHDDILEICKPIIEELNKKENVDDNSNSIIGEVYLYKRGINHKLGFSNDPVRRGKEIKLESPDQLKLIHSIKTDDPRGIEKYWHSRFKDKRIKNTEFFHLSAQDIKAFKRWRKIY